MKQISGRFALKIQGSIAGISPYGVPNVGTGDEQWAPYHDRFTAGAWEVGEVFQDDKLFFFEWPELTWDSHARPRRTFSQPPDGPPQSRPGGTRGPWEAHYATEQPDGSKLFYRFHEGKLLAVELVEIKG